MLLPVTQTKAKHRVKTKWSVNPNKLWVVSRITLIGPGLELPLEYHYCIKEGCEPEECERGQKCENSLWLQTFYTGKQTCTQSYFGMHLVKKYLLKRHAEDVCII